MKDTVGPVLEATPVSRAVIAAIKSLNPRAEIVDRGAYLRVLVPDICVVTKEAIEKHLGRAFVLPADLEMLMPSFKGALTVDENRAEWRC